MHKISLTYKGRSYDFRYYSTTINGENLYFVITQDPVAKEMLIEDHFFIRLPLDGYGMYFFNGIKGTEVENDFKEFISKEILMRWMAPQQAAVVN